MILVPCTLYPDPCTLTPVLCCASGVLEADASSTLAMMMALEEEADISQRRNLNELMVQVGTGL